MKPTLTFLTALLLVTLAALAQAKPEVANATKAAMRAWESAPSEKKALWLKHREALTHMNLFREKDMFASNGEAAASVKANRTLVSKGGTP